MTQKINLGIIFGGRSGEHEVSLMSARSVISVIDRDKYNIYQVGITLNGHWVTGMDVLDKLSAGNTEGFSEVVLFGDPTRSGLYQIKQDASGEKLEKITDLDVIFPVLHGTFGEDGTLQGLLEMADIAYVGAGVLGSSVGMDKGLFKDLMRANNIPVVSSILVSRAEIETGMEDVISRAEQMSGYPLFVKPANLGSSVGISKCINRSDLLEGLQDAAQYDRRILIEKGVNAREIEVSVLGNDAPIASIPGEIRPNADFYSYEAKYILDNSELIIPAMLAEEQKQLIQQYALRAYTCTDCAGMARADFLLDKVTGEVFLNEINTIPGFTKISMYPKLWEASGLPYPALINRLIELGLERKADRDRTLHTFRRGQ
ncbi:MAG: D-alanine--D-alanine ligase A [Anaerolinea sp.]|nr:D-alanine--D-alanine ligase A [Anaerolinea sp.]